MADLQEISGTSPEKVLSDTGINSGEAWRTLQRDQLEMDSEAVGSEIEERNRKPVSERNTLTENSVSRRSMESYRPSAISSDWTTESIGRTSEPNNRTTESMGRSERRSANNSLTVGDTIIRGGAFDDDFMPHSGVFSDTDIIRKLDDVEKRTNLMLGGARNTEKKSEYLKSTTINTTTTNSANKRNKTSTRFHQRGGQDDSLVDTWDNYGRTSATTLNTSTTNLTLKEASNTNTSISREDDWNVSNPTEKSQEGGKSNRRNHDSVVLSNKNTNASESIRKSNRSTSVRSSNRNTEISESNDASNWNTSVRSSNRNMDVPESARNSNRSTVSSRSSARTNSNMTDGLRTESNRSDRSTNITRSTGRNSDLTRSNQRLYTEKTSNRNTDTAESVVNVQTGSGRLTSEWDSLDALFTPASDRRDTRSSNKKRRYPIDGREDTYDDIFTTSG